MAKKSTAGLSIVPPRDCNTAITTKIINCSTERAMGCDRAIKARKLV